MVKHLYGEFSDTQIKSYSSIMHNEIHKLLLYKDPKIEEKIFTTDKDFLSYFNNLLYRFSGFNDLLNQPNEMVSLLSTLQSAYSESQKDDFNYKTFRRLILDSHGYIKTMFEEVD